MRSWLKFVSIGLVLGLFVEAELKLVAGINPSAFGIVLVAYPIILTLAYGGHRLTDKVVSDRWSADLIYYFVSGAVGLFIEWTLLGNNLQSNAFQPGMFAMWTTFLFGPRILARDTSSLERPRRIFWYGFVALALAVTTVIIAAPDRDAKIVVAVSTLSAVYILWSLWLLGLAWRAREDSERQG